LNFIKAKSNCWQQLVKASVQPYNINHLGMLESNYILTNITQQECLSNIQWVFEDMKITNLGIFFYLWNYNRSQGPKMLTFIIMKRFMRLTIKIESTSSMGSRITLIMNFLKSQTSFRQPSRTTPIQGKIF